MILYHINLSYLATISINIILYLNAKEKIFSHIIIEINYLIYVAYEIIVIFRNLILGHSIPILNKISIFT